MLAKDIAKHPGGNRHGDGVRGPRQRLLRYIGTEWGLLRVGGVKDLSTFEKQTLSEFQLKVYKANNFYLLTLQVTLRPFLLFDVRKMF